MDGKKENSRLLKIGFIGGGKMAIKHMQAIKHINNAKIFAVADPNVSKETVKQTAGEEINFFNTADEMFENETIDIIHIVTPKGTHFDLSALAISNGAHIYVEKPFTETTNEAVELFRLAAEKKLKICPGHQLLFQQPAVLSQELIKQIGNPIHFVSYFAFRTARKSISPMDQILDILPHPTYTLLHFMSLMTQKNEKMEIVSNDVKLNGEARVVLKKGNAYGNLIVTLNGRPVDSYLKIIGTNGTLHLDFVRDILIKNLGPGGDALAAVFSPYIRAFQLFWKSTKSFAKLALGKNHSYPGLYELISDFYKSIIEEKEFSISPESIIDSVKIYEQVKNNLETLKNNNLIEIQKKNTEENKSKNLNNNKDIVLLTGGTGFLGKCVAKTLQENGHLVKVVSRSIPEENRRISGIEYYKVDLGGEVPDNIFENVKCVVHCAAETSGGKEDHIKNSIEATKKLYENANKKGINKFIHISSIAVLKTGSLFNRVKSERTPVDSENEGRGPYVWGKAQSEKILKQMEKDSNLKVKILRPGPLVDYKNFEAPGRLGKQIGQRFIVMGSKKSKLSVCDVNSSAKIIQYYIDNYTESPDLLNIVDPEIPSRKDLIEKLSKVQTGLKASYVPSFVVAALSFSLKVIQKIIFPRKKALDIKAAFASEKYDTTLVKNIMQQTSLN